MNPILSLILKRLLIGLLTLWIVTIIIFAAIELLWTSPFAQEESLSWHFA